MLSQRRNSHPVRDTAQGAQPLISALFGLLSVPRSAAMAKRASFVTMSRETVQQCVL
jgi:hypothetical protein